jgi:hypothetical protein
MTERERRHIRVPLKTKHTKGGSGGSGWRMITTAERKKESEQRKTRRDIEPGDT